MSSGLVVGYRLEDREQSPDPVLLNLISFQFKGGEMQTLFFSLFFCPNPSGESQYSCLTLIRESARPGP